MHNLHLSHLVEIADRSCHAIAIKQNLCCLLHSACLYTTVSSWTGILMLQLMSLPTQLAFLNRCAWSACFFFLGVIHKISQAHVGASYPSMPRLSWLVKLYGNLTYVNMRPATIALNYSVKDVRHDVRQIIYIISWKIAIEQTSVRLAHARPNYWNAKV